MSLDLSFHRRKRSFPFSLFGLAAAIGFAVVIVTHTINKSGFYLLDIQNNNFLFSEVIAYTLMISAFLTFMLSIGLISKLNTDFKFILYITRVFIFVFVFLSGYFIDLPEFSIFIKPAFISIIVYQFLLMIFFISQKRFSSRYSSRIIMILSISYIIPLTYITYRIFTIGFYSFFNTSLLIDTISLIIFAVLFYVSLTVNSIYLIYINRKVR